MDKINWAIYNYDEFELFCNALLTFEFGKSYQPFSAPGRDGGIDGAFDGAYGNYTGKWRFQFKFFLAARHDAVRNLKYQVKEEAKKLKDEHYFLLATNVELLPQEVNTIKDAFEEKLKVIGKSCTFLLWDGAKLFTLFVQYPILSLWLNEGFATAQLRPYRNVYGTNLDAQDFNPASLSTFFIGRKKDLDVLTDFLESDDNMAVIAGDAGIGKTRMALEFFENKMPPDWSAIVLVNRNFNLDKIYRALHGEQKYVVLIDDAHTFDPGIIADMKVVSEQLQNVKLILTTRNLQASKPLCLIKEYEHENYLKINLSELSRSETEEVFLRYVGQSEYRHYINQLVTTSFGKPILIVAMLNAMSKGMAISSIKGDQFLKGYVTNYFHQYIERAQADTGLEPVKLRGLLQAVTLLEPFSFQDAELIRGISTLLAIEPPLVTSALRLLIQYQYVDGRYEQLIKPDFYSDIILSEIDPVEVVRFLTQFVGLAGNIIINLSSVDEVNADQGQILNTILQIYIKQIETSTDITFIKKALSTISNITFVKPDIARDTIDIYLSCLKQAAHPLRGEYEEDRRYNYYSGNSAISKVIMMLDYLNESPEHADFVYRRSFTLYSMTQEKKVVNIFGFDKRDMLKHFNMERQDFFLAEYLQKFKRYNAIELYFGLQCLKGFASLDYTLSDWSAVNRDAITITTFYLPASSSVKKFRKKLIDAMIKIYRSAEAAPIHSDVLKTIVDMPRGIFATSRNAKPYKNDSEIKLVLDFLLTEAGKYDLLERKEILENLHWFVKWGVAADLQPLINQVKEALKPRNLIERLSQLFSKAELAILDMPDLEGHVTRNCRALVQTENPEALASGIIQFLEPQPYPPHYYWSFQKTLETEFPEFAKVLHTHLFEHSMQLYGMYAPSILSTMYYYHRDEDYYWQQVRRLELLDTVHADNVILAVYGQRVPQMTMVHKRDTDAIVHIFNKGRTENDFHLSTALQLLFAGKVPEAMFICQQFLARAQQRQTEMFFIRLSDNETVSDDQMADLILNHTVHYELSYEIERCLNLVLLSKGIEVVFDYLIKRYEHKKQEVIATHSLMGYDFLPDGEHSRLFDANFEKKTAAFLKALNWYLDLDDEGVHFFYAKDMLTYLQPGQSLTQELFDHYKRVMGQNETRPRQLERLLTTLSIFHTKDHLIVRLIVEIYPVVNDLQESDSEMYQKLRYACYAALTTMGVKSGNAGQPFQVDIDLKQLLEAAVAALSDFSPAKRFLKDVLKNVAAEIERDRDRENLTW